MLPFFLFILPLFLAPENERLQCKFENDLLMENKTRTLVFCTAQICIVSSIRGFTQKYETSKFVKSMIRYKAWLFARGFVQTKNVDFIKAYAHFAKFTFERTLLSLLAAEHLYSN